MENKAGYFYYLIDKDGSRENFGGLANEVKYFDEIKMFKLSCMTEPICGSPEEIDVAWIPVSNMLFIGAENLTGAVG